MCRDRDKSTIEVDPLTAHVVSWFVDLNEGRTYTVIAGMGGGAMIPNAISHQELAAWSELTGSRPEPWEVTALKAMDKSWRATYDSKQSGKLTPARQYQALGEYCEGKRVDECRRQFGDQLEKVCATCPD